MKICRACHLFWERCMCWYVEREHVHRTHFKMEKPKDVKSETRDVSVFLWGRGGEGGGGEGVVQGRIICKTDSIATDNKHDFLKKTVISST